MRASPRRVARPARDAHDARPDPLRVATAPRGPACSAPRTATSTRPRSCPSAPRATVKTLHPDEVRSLGADVILGNTYHLHFRPGEDVIEELGGLHAFTRLGRADPHRLRRLPGLLAARHARARSTTTASRSARSTTAARSASRPSASPRSSAGSARTSRCASTSARRRTSSPREHEEAVRRTPALGGAAGRRAAGAGPAALRDRAGRHRPRAPHALDRGDRRARRSTATRSAGSRWGRAGPRCSTTVGWAAPLLPAEQPALLHGPRRRRRASSR